MYHFTSPQLKVVQAISNRPENAKLLSNLRLILLEHILPTTEEFIRILENVGVEVFAIIAKPYSKDPKVLKRLKESKLRIIEESYESLENGKTLRTILIDAANQSRDDGKRIAVIDVGGYFAAPLSMLSEKYLEHFVGVVEDTTFGHNRYVNLIDLLQRQDNGKVLKFPIVSVARSELKKIEARFVGRDAVQAMDTILRDLGISITGRNALVIGYGMIGRCVARTLRSYDLNVYVYDLEDRQLLRAFNDGYHIHKKVVLLRHADIIFSATGSEALHSKPAMSFEEIEDCKNGVILASVGSKNTEFDVAALNHFADKKPLNEHLDRYILPNSKYVILANEGTAVNFTRPSIAREIMDLVFSEILQGILGLLPTRREYQPGVINVLDLEIVNKISKAWLRIVNMEAQA